MSFFHSFDLLKSPICFLYKGRDQISTGIGFLLTMVLSILLINSAVHSDFFYKLKPSVSVQSDYKESYARTAFDRANYTLVVKIGDYSGVSHIDFSYFYFNLTFNSYDISAETYTMNKQFMRICEENDFLEEDRKLNLYGKSFCPSQEEPMILRGSGTSEAAQYAIIELDRCDEYSAKHFNVTCKTKAEMDQFMLDKIFYYYYTDNTFDLTNLEKPVKRSLLLNTVYFYPNIKKTNIIYVQKTIIQTDLGQNFLDFSHSQSTLESFRIGSITSDFSYDTVHFHEIFLVADRVTQKMTRSYSKFQDLLAILGGISSSYLVVAGILISNYKKFLIIFEVFGKLFEISDLNIKKKATKVIKKKIDKKTKKPDKKNTGEKKDPPTSLDPLKMISEGCLPNVEEGKVNIGVIKKIDIRMFPMTQKLKLTLAPPEFKDSSLAEPSISPTINVPKIIEEPEKTKEKSVLSFNEFEDFNEGEKKSKNSGIAFKYWEYLKFQLKFFFGINLTHKETYMFQAEKTFKEEMDVLKILEKIKEIEKLKLIIFDPEQKNVFDILAKRKIILKEEQSEKKSNVLREYSINKKRRTTKLDERLLSSIRKN